MIWKKIINSYRLYVQRVVEKIYNLVQKDIYILMFHQVKDRVDTVENEDYCISVNHFKEFISLLEKKNCKFISLSQLTQKATERRVLLSFDDAYEDVYKNVYPYLSKKGIPFVVFQTAAYIDQKDYLSTAMIREMLKYKGFTLGAHSCEHKKPYDMNEEECREDIINAKLFLEKKFGVNVKYYAFPYGSFNNVKLSNIKALKNTGIELGFSTLMSGFNSITKRNKFFLPRVNVNDKNYKRIYMKFWDRNKI